MVRINGAPLLILPYNDRGKICVHGVDVEIGPDTRWLGLRDAALHMSLTLIHPRLCS
jgi:hypothetical protein